MISYGAVADRAGLPGYARYVGYTLKHLPPESSLPWHRVINSEGSLKGKLPFNFRSQIDSTFLEFSDMIGRKALFVWITNNSITARNLIDNKQYKYKEVTELLPILKVLEPKDITKIIWGVQPNYKERFENIPQSVRTTISLDFHRENNNLSLIHI